jgi:hypothetical protein
LCGFRGQQSLPKKANTASIPLWSKLKIWFTLTSFSKIFDGHPLCFKLQVVWLLKPQVWPLNLLKKLCKYSQIKSLLKKFHLKQATKKIYYLAHGWKKPVVAL